VDSNTRWFKYDRDYFYVKKSQFVPVIFEPPCTFWTAIRATALWGDKDSYILLYVHQSTEEECYRKPMILSLEYLVMTKFLGIAIYLFIYLYIH
jgi:hypothetical protein